MKQILKDSITFEVTDPDIIPHKALARKAEDSLERVRIPEFVDVDGLPYPVHGIGTGFLTKDSKATQVDIPCTVKTVRADAFSQLDHGVILAVDALEVPKGFEDGWQAGGVIRLNEPTGLQKLMTPTQAPSLSLRKDKPEARPEKKENTNILTAEGLRNRAQHWNTRTVILVVTVVLLVFVGVAVGVGFYLKK